MLGFVAGGDVLVGPPRNGRLALVASGVEVVGPVGVAFDAEEVAAALFFDDGLAGDVPTLGAAVVETEVGAEVGALPSSSLSGLSLPREISSPAAAMAAIAAAANNRARRPVRPEARGSSIEVAVACKLALDAKAAASRSAAKSGAQSSGAVVASADISL